MQYTQDYDETLPCGSQLNFGGKLGGGWAGQVYSYVKSTAVFACPDDINSGYPANNPPSYPVSYAYNALIPNSFNPVQGKLAGFTSPARTVMISECTYSYADISAPNEDSPTGATNDSGVSGEYSCGSTGNAFFCGVDSKGNGGIDPYVWGSTGDFDNNGNTLDLQIDTVNPSGRHTGGSNYVFADGHAKFARATQMCPGGNNAANPTAAPILSTNYSGDHENNAACGADFAGDATHPDYVGTWSVI
jgi:prepilin-type processing-associated H-X9-DG protein